MNRCILLIFNSGKDRRSAIKLSLCVNLYIEEACWGCQGFIAGGGEEPPSPPSHLPVTRKTLVLHHDIAVKGLEEL